MPPPKPALTEGQRAYESRRAQKAGMSLEKWLAAKDRQAAEITRAEDRARKAAAAKPAKPPGFFGRLLEKAQKPL